MPELPDLQVFSSNLQRRLKNKKLEKLTIAARAKMNVSGAALRKALGGQTLEKVERSGKELHFVFKNQNVLSLHMMLHGYLYWEEGKARPHTLMVFSFSGGIGLALADFQRQAHATLNPPQAAAPDALSKEVNVRFWRKALLSKAVVKNLLMDQQVIRGIGNAYADEILWKAGISPFSISNKIPGDKIPLLAKSVKAVLKNAEKQIRKSSPGIIGGEIRDFLRIHNAHKEQSPGGATIRKKTAGGRKTYFTDEQELYT